VLLIPIFYLINFWVTRNWVGLEAWLFRLYKSFDELVIAVLVNVIGLEGEDYLRALGGDIDRFMVSLFSLFTETLPLFSIYLLIFYESALRLIVTAVVSLLLLNWDFWSINLFLEMTFLVDSFLLNGSFRYSLDKAYYRYLLSFP
jgi:hypothetical protein